jgi:ribosomal protein RSM22 (predicted rRNA methylase)
MPLPEPIRTAIEALLDGTPIHTLAHDYQSISERYRREVNAPSLQIATLTEALAYAAVRLPATYGAVASVCSQVKLSLPDFTPRTLLDLGAGPGTACLAAFHAWPETLVEADLIEPNTHLRSVSEKLLATLSMQVTHQAWSLAQTRLDTTRDLVMASYVLNEISAIDLKAELSRLWQATGGVLVLIEPGTPLGFEIVLKARSILLELGAFIAAPCPHHTACPLSASERWCHFSTRIERSALHRKIKDQATLAYEDEKFSYIVASRTAPIQLGSRLLGHPHGTKIIDLELCQPDGTETVKRLSKRDPDYKKARKLKWGETL